MLRRQRGGRRRALLSVWSSVPNVRTQSGRLEPNCNSVLRRRGTGLHRILVFVIGRSGKSLKFCAGLVPALDLLVLRLGGGAIERDDDLLNKNPVRVHLDDVVQVRNLLKLDEEGFSPVAVCDLGHPALTRHWSSVPASEGHFRKL